MTKIKKLLSLFLSLAVIVATFAVMAVPASAKSVFSGAKKIEPMEYYNKTLQYKNDEIYYKFVISKPGTVTFRYNSQSDMNFAVYNSNADNIYSYSMYYSNGKEISFSKAGTYYLHFKANYDGAWFKDFYYKFNPVEQPALTLSLPMKKGQTLNISAFTENYDGKVTWLSTKTSVATISKGVITAKSSGKTTIRATLDNGTYEEIRVVVS